jgi:hypothetical protein
MDYSMLVGFEERDDVNHYISKQISSNSSIDIGNSLINPDEYRRTTTLDKI